MIAITSPAKTQDFDSKVKASLQTVPSYIKDADLIANKLKKLTKKDLQSLLNVSEKLAELNFERYEHWDSASEREAILAYKGDIYRQFIAESFSEEREQYTQRHIRIISGLYGVLRPYDLIKPYRLEMKTNISSLDLDADSLASFWQEKVTSELNSLLREFDDDRKILVNLSSKEYADAVDFESIEGTVLQIEFRQIKSGEEKNLGIYAKRARGQFISFLTSNMVKRRQELLEFSIDGYELKSEKENELVFLKKID